jgi:dihydroorotate dehydrogenase (NAD+) catalytic subunit
MNSLEVDFAGVKFRNPVVTTSGTWGYGLEKPQVGEAGKIGGLTLKALTLEKREGNPHPRIVETEAGLLNSIGLQNEGLGVFLKDIAPQLEKLDTRVIVNLSGNTEEDFVELVRAVSAIPKIDLIELNVSCPNLHANKMEFGTDVRSLSNLIASCVKVSSKPIMPKLSPNVTSIVDMAKAAEDSGAMAISMVNTFLGMSIDIERRQPMLARTMGGYSGPGIKPIALRMVYQVARVVKLPILGIGGVARAEDVIEFLLAGATLVGIGTAGALDPNLPAKCVKNLASYLRRHQLTLTQLKLPT